MFPEYISTKCPINGEIIESIKKTGYCNPIQVSWTPGSPRLLKQTISVKNDYITKMLQGIKLLDDSELKYRITSVLTT
jgi:hypothetical protein